MLKPDLRILHISSAKSWRGGERQLAFLVEELSKKGIHQAVLCVRGSALEAWCKEHAIPFFPYRKIFSLNPIVAIYIRWICRRMKISHVHTHDSHGHTFAVLSAGIFRNKTPIVVHRRVDFPIGENRMSSWKYNHPSVQAIICVSHFVKKLIQGAIKNPEKIRVVHDGIDLDAFPKNGPTQQRSTASLTIGNIAALAPHKDYFTFVRTAEILLKEGLSAKFLLIGGDGGEEAAIRGFIQEKNLNENLELTGFQTEILPLLQQLDILLFTSKTEGLGSSLLDAFAAGVPVVATAAGGIPEIVEDGVTGLLAPVGNAEILAAQVRRMLEEEPLRQRILANAKKKVEHFSKAEMAAQIMACYR